jgi:hypothetical protein
MSQEDRMEASTMRRAERESHPAKILAILKRIESDCGDEGLEDYSGMVTSLGSFLEQWAEVSQLPGSDNAKDASG